MSNDEQLIWLPPHRVSRQVSILAEKLDYAHELMNVPFMWTQTMGAGVKVCVIDSGVPNHMDIQLIEGHSVIPDYYEDLNGHATHVGGIIAAVANNGLGVAGIAPAVEDYYIAALDGDGSGSVAGIAKAIRYAVDVMGVDIINMSLGISDGAPHFQDLEAACDYAVSQDVTVIAAAGNEAGGVGQPASYDSVIAVAAVDSVMDHAWFSNVGPAVEFAAPGVAVFSTYKGNSYATLDGTSMASPNLTGIAALIKAKHRLAGEELSPQDIRDHLKKIAFDLGPTGWDQKFGAGIPVFGSRSNPPGPPNPPVDPPVDPPIPPTPPVPPTPPTPPTPSSKALPTADCAYWTLAHGFVSELDAKLHAGVSLADATAAAIRTAAKHMRVINIAVKSS